MKRWLDRIPDDVMKKIADEKRWVERDCKDPEYLIVSTKLLKALESQLERIVGKPVKQLRCMGLKVLIDDELSDGEIKIF